MPRKVFVAGEILTAADVNTNLMDQAVMVFDDSAARGSAIPTPAEGMVTYLKDTNQVSAFNGSAFAPLGTILQVVQATKTNTFTTSSTTFVTVTDMTATITPSATSSKILVMVQLSASAASEAGGATSHFRLAGGNTSGYVGDTASNRVRSITSLRSASDSRIDTSMFGLSMIVLDSPATTSSTTYSVEMRTNGDLGAVNRSTNDTDNTQFGRGASSITVLEVAG